MSSRSRSRWATQMRCPFSLVTAARAREAASSRRTV